MSKIIIIAVVIATIIGTILLYTSYTANKDEEFVLYPENIGQEEKIRYMITPIRSATSQNAMVVGESWSPAVAAGLDVLHEGGNAVDAVLTTGLAQITLIGGAWSSFAGKSELLYYEAKTGKVYTMNATWKKPQLQDTPIPETGGATALVPGFMAGLGSAHERFGTLPLSRILEPSIFFAQEGVRVTPLLSYLISARQETLSQYPETQAVFFNSSGSFLKKGDVFKQTKLANTLSHIATEGTAYMYTGAWGERYVEAIQKAGGSITKEDMKGYAPIWSEPVTIRFGEYEIYFLGLPTLEGACLASGLKVLEHLPYDQGVSYEESTKNMYYLVQSIRSAYLWYGYFSGYLPESSQAIVKKYLEFDTISPSQIYSDEATEKMAALIRSEAWNVMLQEIQVDYMQEVGKKPQHTDCVVAVDQEGNIASFQHTINTVLWGNTGLFVDGVSVSDAGLTFKEAVDRTKPGDYFWDGGTDLIVLKHSKPFLVSANTGADQIGVTMQNLFLILECNADPLAATDAHHFYIDNSSDLLRIVVGEDTFAELHLAALEEQYHEKIKTVSQDDLWEYDSTWIGIKIDQESNTITGAVPLDSHLYYFGHAAGY